ncbi:hypothetical protein [Actinomadura sp. DC4]|uniref:hypothetical protein n=1 Tax=Actinomadura sp. DC4 TaxID=3055069 RepID=UPI0025B026DB|nr:hypothetical protein [Actinomadura sp. DC4]MDN3353756.1 hypothetical protein [Actinomadura sp. DC4]
MTGLIGSGLGATAGLREGADPLRADVDVWVAELTRLGTEQSFDAFVFWPEEETLEQVRRSSGVSASLDASTGHGRVTDTLKNNGTTELDIHATTSNGDIAARSL